jgi:signal peptidase I
VAIDPPNPYAPSLAVAREGDGVVAARPARWLAVLATLLCFQPLAGLGLLVLGRKRRFLYWCLPATAAYGLMLGAVWTVKPSLFLVAFVAAVSLGLASLVDTIVAKPSTALPAPSPAPTFRRALVTVLIVFVAERAGLYAVKRWVVEAFNIPSGAMVPTLLVGDHIMVRKQVGAIQRGDLVVYRDQRDPSVSYIKRILAVAGDTIEFRSDTILVNGVPLPTLPRSEKCPTYDERPPEPGCRLVAESIGPRSYTIMLAENFEQNPFEKVVPSGHVFVVGDNRHNSMDSRFTGPVPEANLVGSATFIYWSRDLDRLGRRL